MENFPTIKLLSLALHGRIDAFKVSFKSKDQKRKRKKNTKINKSFITFEVTCCDWCIIKVMLMIVIRLHISDVALITTSQLIELWNLLDLKVFSQSLLKSSQTYMDGKPGHL